MSVLASPTATEWLEVIRTGKCDWRVSDARRDASDPERLLGFVERLSHRRFEILWLTEPLRWGYVTTLQAAVAGLRDRAAFTEPQVIVREHHEPERGGLRRWEF